MSLRQLTASIAQIVRDKGPLCARCLTELTAAKHGTDNVDVRVAVVELTLGEQFTSGGKCRTCDAPEQARNPVLQAALGWHPAGEADTFSI